MSDFWDGPVLPFIVLVVVLIMLEIWILSQADLEITPGLWRLVALRWEFIVLAGVYHLWPVE